MHMKQPNSRDFMKQVNNCLIVKLNGRRQSGNRFGIFGMYNTLNKYIISVNWNVVAGIVDSRRLQCTVYHYQIPGLILGLRPANGRRRYKVTPPLIGWAQTQNQPLNTMLADTLAFCSSSLWL